MEYLIETASPQETESVLSFLAACDLPNQDLTAAHLADFLLLKDGDQLLGCAGLEIYGQVALLRSVAVDESHRGQGLGKRLLKRTESLALNKGVQSLYLLTTSAEQYFAAHGYIKIDRYDAPDAIRKTSEFRSMCPDSAICMSKELG